VNRDARIGHLPLALAIGLRLHEAGAADALIAVGLGIEPEGVPPMLELAKAKLHRLEAGIPGKPETEPDSDGAISGGSSEQALEERMIFKVPSAVAGNVRPGAASGNG